MKLRKEAWTRIVGASTCGAGDFHIDSRRGYRKTHYRFVYNGTPRHLFDTEAEARMYFMGFMAGHEAGHTAGYDFALKDKHSH